jgi:hypothetical protein
VNALGIDRDGMRSFSAETARSSKDGLLRKVKSKCERRSELRVGHPMHRSLRGDLQPQSSVRILKTQKPGGFSRSVEDGLELAMIVRAVLGRNEVLKGLFAKIRYMGEK